MKNTAKEFIQKSDHKYENENEKIKKLDTDSMSLLDFIDA